MHGAEQIILLSCRKDLVLDIEAYFVGNKAKGRISKRVLQENKACQIFRKTNWMAAYISESYR